MTEMTIARNSALIADDDEFFRIALIAILTQKLGFAEVVEAGSFDQAMELIGGRDDLSLALFDLSMPGMDSIANLSAVRECTPSIRTAVVSASTSRRDILAALGAGVHGYIPKNLGATELCRAIDTVLAGAIFVPPLLADLQAASGEEAPEFDTAAKPMRERAAAALTLRQREVLDLLVKGKSNKEIARSLKLGEGTVKIHVAALFRNLGVENRAAAAVAGARMLL